MKCEFCGGDLSLEMENCPHCGQTNKYAQQHIKDMRHYHGEFENTKKGVYTATNKYVAVAVRVVVIALLVMLIGGLYLLGDRAYDVNRAIRKSDAKRHVEEYTRILDAYLIQEDFRGFYQFVEEKDINGYYEDGEYDDYTSLGYTVYSYLYVCERIMDLSAREPGQDGTDEDMAYDIAGMCDSMDSFYTGAQYSYTDYDGKPGKQVVRDALDVMKTNILLMLQTYCGMTPEELEDWEDFSTAKRTVLIEEKMYAE